MRTPGGRLEADCGLLRRDPSELVVRLGLARALRWSGRPLSARFHARKALARVPERDDACEELARSYAQVGQRAATGLILQETTPSRELGAAGGGTFPLIAQGARGWFAGRMFGLKTRRLTTALRGEYRVDAYYEQWRLWLAVDVAL